ncbi:hypothetical protein HYX04_00785 [Candidatus Woesearchaeota archaeon]|nr:hypothetical protein [Candidatus Woesearchaeota archaeon]
MGIELVLEEATPEQTEKRVKNSPFEILARSGYKLFFGAEVSGRRNQYWYNPQKDKFVVDYWHTFDDVENLMSVLNLLKAPAFQIDKKQKRDRELMTALSCLNRSLAEILLMYEKGKIDLSGSVLGISNRSIYHQINELRMRAFILNSIPIGTQEFASGVDELVSYYQTPHPPSQ